MPNEAKSYVDDDISLSPFTTYEYRVVAESVAGIGRSQWQQVTTKSSREKHLVPRTLLIVESNFRCF